MQETTLFKIPNEKLEIITLGPYLRSLLIHLTVFCIKVEIILTVFLPLDFKFLMIHVLKFRFSTVFVQLNIDFYSQFFKRFLLWIFMPWTSILVLYKGLYFIADRNGTGILKFDRIFNIFSLQISIFTGILWLDILIL